jgi:Fic family protein
MRIIERSKKGNRYYYLQHSYRRGGKVVTKERYIGKEIPKDIRELMREMENESNKDLHAKIESIKENFLKEWKSYPESVKEKEKEEIAIAFTYNTNAIEGSTITLEETREIVHDGISPKKPLRDVKETDAHSRVFLSMLDIKEKMSVDTLLQWHREIFGETKADIAGRFRTYLVRIGSHIAADWQDIETLMKELMDFIRKSETNAVDLAARAHYRFEKIHPFGDGNGRIGRLLMNYILWHNGYPMMIIEYKNRKSYYKALAKDEQRFVKYFLRRYLSIHKKRYSNRPRKAFTRKIEDLKFLKKFRSQSTMTEKDAIGMGRKVNKGLAGRRR